MTEIQTIIINIAADVIITTSVWGLLDNGMQKYFFGLGISIYLLKKYI
jgi:hypothetical protein